MQGGNVTLQRVFALQSPSHSVSSGLFSTTASSKLNHKMLLYLLHAIRLLKQTQSSPIQYHELRILLVDVWSLFV